MFISGMAVKGYQSLYDVKLQFGNFTVVYGESDVGKSALFRALRGLVDSELGDDFISKGLSSTAVALQLGSGEKIAWLKKKGKSGEYTAKFNPESPLRTWRRNKRLPPDLSKLLRFGEMTVDGDKIYPNFRSQFDSLYLIFDSSGRRAKVIGSLVSGILLRAIKQANLERVRTDADIRSLTGLIEDLHEKETFDWDDLLIKIAIETKVLQQLRKAQDLMEQLSVLVEDKEKLEKVLSVDVEYLPDGVFDGFDELVNQHAELKMEMSLLEHSKNVIKDLGSMLKKATAHLEGLDLKLADLEKKLTFLCPHCGKPISKLEVDFG